MVGSTKVAQVNIPFSVLEQIFSQKCKNCGHELKYHHTLDESGSHCEGNNGTCDCKSFEN